MPRRKEPRIPDAILDQLLAVLREALANIARHTAANHVDVKVTAGNELVLRVSDDGGGTPVAWAKPLRSVEGRQ